MIRDQNQVARLEVFVDASTRIRRDEHIGSESSEHPHPEHDRLSGMAFVEMRPSPHHGDRHPGERSDHERAHVAEGRRCRPPGNLGVRDLDRILDVVGEPSQAGPENHRCPRDDRGPLTDRGDCEVDHADPSATRAS